MGHGRLVALMIHEEAEDTGGVHCTCEKGTMARSIAESSSPQRTADKSAA